MLKSSDHKLIFFLATPFILNKKKCLDRVFPFREHGPIVNTRHDIQFLISSASDNRSCVAACLVPAEEFSCAQTVGPSDSSLQNLFSWLLRALPGATK